MPRYIINPKTKTYEVIRDEDTGLADAIRKRMGIKLFETTELPDNTYTNDRFLILNIEIPLQLDVLLHKLPERVNSLLAEKPEGIVFFWVRDADYHFELKGTMFTEPSAIPEEQGKVILRYFPADDKNIIKLIGDFIKETRKNLVLKD